MGLESGWEYFCFVVVNEPGVSIQLCFCVKMNNNDVVVISCRLSDEYSNNSLYKQRTKGLKRMRIQHTRANTTLTAPFPVQMMPLLPAINLLVNGLFRSPQIIVNILYCRPQYCQIQWLLNFCNATHYRLFSSSTFVLLKSVHSILRRRT